MKKNVNNMDILPRYKFLLVLLVTLSTFTAGCQPAPAPVERKDTTLAFGTFVETTLIGVTEQEQALIMKTINEKLEYYHYAFHPWKAGPTGRTNQLLAAAGEFSTIPSLLPLLEQSQLLYRQSNGLFNPAIGKLMALWGYHEEIPSDGPPPDEESIQAILDQKPRMDDLTIKGVRITNTNPAVQLDFGAVAKGYVLDILMQDLQSMGVKNAIINTGGDLKVLGSHVDRPWRIAIRHPRQSGLLASLDVADGEAVFTSGDYERYYEYEGKRYHHILDPRSGYPADQVQSVTVIHTNGAVADAAATALFVAGPEQWLETARNMGIKQAMLVDKSGTVHITDAMHQRIHFEQPDLDIKVIATP